MARMYYQKANAAVIVYDITSHKSFEQAKEWVQGNTCWQLLYFNIHIQFAFTELHRNIKKDIGKGITYFAVFCFCFKHIILS